MRLGIAVRFFEENYYVKKNYISYFTSLGFEVDFIHKNSILDGFDGFILPGGYDIDPKYYNEENISSNHIIAYNDSLDFKVMDYALKYNKPVIGICRGLQSINVFFNGSLYQDMKQHMKNNHFIKMNQKYYFVNSYHHQSIKKLGDSLKVLATSTDGQIEIIQHKKITGVQFHPELMNTPVINKLILQFINEV